MKKPVLILFFFLFLLFEKTVAQDRPPVLEPENANEARLNRLQPPDQVMDAFGIEPGMVVAEIGAGRGRYVVQLAVRVGESGKVYAEDINAASLRHLDLRCERGGLSKVESILGEVTDPKLPENTLDRIFIISSYHHFDEPITLLRNARTALKPDGKLAIGEWLQRPGENHPEHKTPEEMENEMKAAGYKLEKIETFLEENGIYLYLFTIDESQQPSVDVINSSF